MTEPSCSIFEKWGASPLPLALLHKGGGDRFSPSPSMAEGLAGGVAAGTPGLP
jgi:hypothetical protein